MVLIWISDEVWAAYRKSMAPFGPKTHEELVEALEHQLWDESRRVLEEGERHLISDEPEALALREQGLRKELGLQPHEEIPEEDMENFIRESEKRYAEIQERLKKSWEEVGEEEGKEA